MEADPSEAVFFSVFAAASVLEVLSKRNGVTITVGVLVTCTLVRRGRGEAPKKLVTLDEKRAEGRRAKAVRDEPNKDARGATEEKR